MCVCGCLSLCVSMSSTALQDAGPPSECSHALRCSVAASECQAVGECSRSLDGSRGYRTCTSSQWVGVCVFVCMCLSLSLRELNICHFVIYDSPETLSRIMGNVVLKNPKAQFVITHKLLLLQYHHKVGSKMYCINVVK